MVSLIEVYVDLIRGILDVSGKVLDGKPSMEGHL